jgi:hypothetical protein
LGPNQCSFHAFSADSRTAAWQSVYTSSSHLPERRSPLKVCSTKRLNHKSSKNVPLCYLQINHISFYCFQKGMWKWSNTDSFVVIGCKKGRCTVLIMINSLISTIGIT